MVNGFNASMRWLVAASLLSLFLLPSGAATDEAAPTEDNGGSDSSKAESTFEQPSSTQDRCPLIPVTIQDGGPWYCHNGEWTPMTCLIWTCPEGGP